MPRLVAELHAQFAESAKLEEAIRANLDFSATIAGLLTHNRKFNEAAGIAGGGFGIVCQNDSGRSKLGPTRQNSMGSTWIVVFS